MSILKTVLFSVVVLFAMSACSGASDLAPKDAKLLLVLNDAVEPFTHKKDIIEARGVIVESINRGLVDKDSLVLVETISPEGIYECVAYIYHNQMITFYNAKKGIENSDEFSKIEVRGTPFEALTFIDAIQMNSFEAFMDARDKDIPGDNGWWLITFLGKDQDQYSAKNYYAK